MMSTVKVNVCPVHVEITLRLGTKVSTDSAFISLTVQSTCTPITSKYPSSYVDRADCTYYFKCSC